MLYSHVIGLPFAKAGKPDKTVNFEFKAVFKNSGRSPAVRATIESILYTVEQGDPLPKVPEDVLWADMDFAGYVGSGDQQGGQGHPISIEDLHRNIAGEINHILFARISYEDMWGGMHVTEASVYIFVRVPAEVLEKSHLNPGKPSFIHMPAYEIAPHDLTNQTRPQSFMPARSASQLTIFEY